MEVKVSDRSDTIENEPENRKFFEYLVVRNYGDIIRHNASLANILRGKTSFSRVFFTSFKIKPRGLPLVNNRLFACGKRFKTSIYNRFRTHLPYNTER